MKMAKVVRVSNESFAFLVAEARGLEVSVKDLLDSIIEAYIADLVEEAPEEEEAEEEGEEEEESEEED